jgi:hypothetical protein
MILVAALAVIMSADYEKVNHKKIYVAIESRQVQNIEECRSIGDKIALKYEKLPYITFTYSCEGS